MSTIKLVQGDFGHSLGLTIEDSENGQPLDLSSGITRLYFKKVGANQLTATMIGTLVNGGVNGEVDFVWPQGALDEPGQYVGELEFEVPGLKKLTSYDVLRFFVRKQQQVI